MAGLVDFRNLISHAGSRFCRSLSITEKYSSRQLCHRARGSFLCRFSGRRSYVNSSLGQDQEKDADEFLPATTSQEEMTVHPYKSLFPWKSRNEFHKSLLENIIYDGDGLVAVNKPFGIGVKAMHHKYSRDDPRGHDNLHLRGIGTSDYTLQEAIPFLQESLGMPELVLVKSTEKMTSGIAVFATDDKAAEKFQKVLVASKSQSVDDPLYKYHVVVAGIPYSKELTFKEKVGLQLKLSSLSDIKQPVITREYSINAMKRKDVIPVHVQVNVLRRSSFKTTLLEIETSSVKWNFLRVYPADILMPVLGDHLYSCRIKTIMGLPTKIDPTHLTPGSAEQKLNPIQLEALGFQKESDTIFIPPHIHLRSYVLKNYFRRGESLELVAPYPYHFQWTLEKLRLQ